MRCICKNERFLCNNSGETMVEVLVAFTLLSIMLVIFSQGIAWATKTTINASNNREAADNAMLQAQHMIVTDRRIPIGERAEANRVHATTWSFCDGRVCYTKYVFEANGVPYYTYVVYEAMTD